MLPVEIRTKTSKCHFLHFFLKMRFKKGSVLRKSEVLTLFIIQNIELKI